MENDNSTEEFTVDFGEVIDTGGGGTSDFNELSNRPKYSNSLMTGDTNIPKVPTKTSELTNDQNYQTGAEVQSAVSSATSGKQDKLMAGANITISDDTISAIDTTYTAGNGIDITSGEISVDTQVVATQSDLSGKQDALTAGNNITISSNTISATDTTYSAFTGTDGQTAGTSGLVPAPATTDAGKFLKSDSTWGTVEAGPTVVQTTGTSTTDVMSQNATTKMVTLSPSDHSVNILSSNDHGTNTISIGNNSTAYQFGAIAIGGGSSSSDAAYTTSVYTIAIGSKSKARGDGAVTIGYGATARKESTSLGHEAGSGGSAIAEENVYLGHQAGIVSHSNKNSVALGHYAQITRDGEVSVGASDGTSGYGGTSYRVIGNVYDGQDAHDVATVGQVNATIDAINTALSVNIPHIGASN